MIIVDEISSGNGPLERRLNLVNTKRMSHVYDSRAKEIGPNGSSLEIGWKMRSEGTFDHFFGVILNAFFSDALYRAPLRIADG